SAVAPSALRSASITDSARRRTDEKAAPTGGLFGLPHGPTRTSLSPLRRRSMDDANRVPIDIGYEVAAAAEMDQRTVVKKDGTVVIDILAPQPCAVRPT